MDKTHFILRTIARTIALSSISCYGARREVWTMHVATKVDRSRPWPIGSPQMMAIAQMKVADLSRDERLRRELAYELAKWAARWWSCPMVAWA